VTVERNSTEAAFRTRYEADHPEAASAARSLLHWANERSLSLTWRAGPTHDTALGFLKLGVHDHKVFTLETNGLVWVLFTELGRRFPSTTDGAKNAFLNGLRERLSKVSGGRARAGSQGAKASWKLEVTDVPALLSVLDWALADLRRHYAELLSSHRKHRS
jgi:hypothetical protein